MQMTLFNYVELQDNAFFNNHTWNFEKKRFIRFTYNSQENFRPFHLGKSYEENTNKRG
jgi:hypothetical protein